MFIFVRVAVCITDCTSLLLGYSLRLSLSFTSLFSNLLLTPFPPFCYCCQLFKIVHSINFHQVTWFIIPNLTCYYSFHSPVRQLRHCLLRKTVCFRTQGTFHLLQRMLLAFGLHIGILRNVGPVKNKYNWIFNKRHFSNTFFLAGAVFFFITLM